MFSLPVGAATAARCLELAGQTSQSISFAAPDPAAPDLAAKAATTFVLSIGFGIAVGTALSDAVFGLAGQTSQSNSFAAACWQRCWF